MYKKGNWRPFWAWFHLTESHNFQAPDSQAQNRLSANGRAPLLTLMYEGPMALKTFEAAWDRGWSRPRDMGSPWIWGISFEITVGTVFAVWT